MAETLEINQMLANQYEPKRTFQWIVEIDGIDAFTAKSFARPSRNAERVTIDYINEKRFLAGKTEWQEFELQLYDPIAPSQAQKVMDWLRLVHDETVGRMGYKAMYARDFSLKMIDGMGNVVEKWSIKRAWPENAVFGELDYGTSDAMTVALTLKYDYAVLEF